MIAPPSVDLREAVRKHPLALPGVEELSPAELELSREHWRVHMAAELASARVFAGLMPQLMAASFDLEVIREVADMARQEVDHGLASARVLAALGGDPCSLLPPLPPVPSHPGASPLEVVLRNLIAVSCCGETLAVAVIGGERERASTEALRAILGRILADEVGHARLGWRVLRDVASSLDAATRRRLSAYLVALFERDLRSLAPSRAIGEASERALAFGAPDGELIWGTFLDTVSQVTVPGLERHGLAARWAFETAWRCALGDEALPALAAAA